MSLPRVFVTRRIPQVGLDRIQQACEVDLWSDPLPPPPAVLKEKGARVDGLLTMVTDRIDGELLRNADLLKVVSNYAVGVNNIDVAECTANHVRVGHTPDVLTEATADHAMALLLSAARRVVESHRFAVSGAWRTWEPLGHIGQDLKGRTLGVFGMGRIGKALARRCRFGWEMEILYHDVVSNPSAEHELQARRVDFDTLLTRSDFVSVHADLNESTKGVFNAQAFRKMKRSAVFINAARGPLHVQADLVHALRAHEIFAAGLDVTDPEPPDVHDELLRLPNLVLTPHIASATVESRDAMARIAAENLIAGVLDQPMPHCVNPEALRGR